MQRARGAGTERDAEDRGEAEHGMDGDGRRQQPAPPVIQQLRNRPHPTANHRPRRRQLHPGVDVLLGFPHLRVDVEVAGADELQGAREQDEHDRDEAGPQHRPGGHRREVGQVRAPSGLRSFRWRIRS